MELHLCWSRLHTRAQQSLLPSGPVYERPLPPAAPFCFPHRSLEICSQRRDNKKQALSGQFLISGAKPDSRECLPRSCLFPLSGLQGRPWGERQGGPGAGGLEWPVALAPWSSRLGRG